MPDSQPYFQGSQSPTDSFKWKKAPHQAAEYEHIPLSKECWILLSPKKSLLLPDDQSSDMCTVNLTDVHLSKQKALKPLADVKTRIHSHCAVGPHHFTGSTTMANGDLIYASARRTAGGKGQAGGVTPGHL
jgi:hypothetical protein